MIKVLLGFICISLASCCSADAPNYQFVKVGKYKLAYACRGPESAKQTVLMVAGMGLDAYSTFKNTFRNAAANDYRICMYDRAGTAKSKYENPKVRPISALADELNGFVEAIGIQKLILAPHSFGGFVARAYAHKYPAKVSGIVFIDSAHESWYEDMKTSMSPDAWKTMEWIMEWERSKHSFEDFAEASSHSSIYKISETLPVIVLSRGIPHVNIRQTKMRYKDVDAYSDSWDRSQEKLKLIGKNIDSIEMKYASHLYDETDPWVVIEQLERIVGLLD
ncbi:MAG: alpha/beta hydrolase [Cellvibrionaceae bacterium]|nr:alpha/beta hydrolase [Cellvibrionaceae bacterium]